MMDRAGLASLMRPGGAPASGRNLAHLAPGEMVLPQQLLQQRPMLRQHAMRSMAQQGRDPLRYTVGARNSRNPRTGGVEFADTGPLVYTDQGWVDSSTGQAPVYDNASYANTGTVDPNAWQAPAAGTGKVYNPQPVYQPEDTGGYAPPAAGTPRVYNPQSSYTSPDPGTPKFYPPVAGTPKQYAPTVQSYDAQSPAQGAVMDAQAPAQSFSDFQTPATYDAWRATRNPQGKGFVDQSYGNAVPQGTPMGLDALMQGAPNVMGGQMPVGSPSPWSLPGTALGIASQGQADTPSILNNGYQNPGYQQSGMAGWPSPYGNPQGGITGGMGSAAAGGQTGGQQRQQNILAGFQY